MSMSGTPIWPGLEWAQTHIDEVAALRALAGPWKKYETYKARFGNVVGRVTEQDIRAPSWEANVLVAGSIRDLGWFHSAADGMAAVEQVIAELAGEQ